jgi:hypothetical protein
MIYYMVEGQSSDVAVVEDARKKYTFGLHILHDFSQMWLGASLVHRLFEAIQFSADLFSRPRPKAGDGDASDSELLEPLPYPTGVRISSKLTNDLVKQ